MTDERHEKISRRAYEMWEQEGGEHGRHEDHWHRAAGEVEGDGQGTPVAPDGTTLTEPADSPAAAPGGANDDLGVQGDPEPADSAAAVAPAQTIAAEPKAAGKPAAKSRKSKPTTKQA